MEAIDLPDASVDLIIANHVLEHVDDAKASRELSRILRPNGVLLCMVPIVEGWATTYQNPDITTDEGRMLHFGQEDHVLSMAAISAIELPRVDSTFAKKSQPSARM
jgi:predicted SAM-dependent methyltransferase